MCFFVVADRNDAVSWDEENPDHYSEVVWEDGEGVECSLWCCFGRVCFCLRVVHEGDVIIFFGGSANP